MDWPSAGNLGPLAWGIALGLFLGLGGCSVTPQAKMRPPFAGISGPVIIAHRGGALEAPENTLAAVAHGVKVGSDWQEIDVTLSRDDKVVVVHDDTLERTTTGAGDVRALDWAELRSLQTGRPEFTDSQKKYLSAEGVKLPDWGETYATETIPSLNEVLGIEGARLMIEMKKIEPGKVKLLARKVVEIVRQHDAAERVILGSFEPDLLWAVHDLDPTLAKIGIAGTSDELEIMVTMPVQALAVYVDRIKEARDKAPASTAVWAWTAYTPQMAEDAIAQGAHGVITDVPEAVYAKFRPEIDPYIKLEKQ